MKKRQNLPVFSLGGEEPVPGAGDLALWARRQKSITADLMSYQIEHSLLSQADVAFPSSGGMFYSERLISSISGLSGSDLIREPGLEPGMMHEDARRLARIRKGVWCTLPSPLSLCLKDRYYHDQEEFVASLSSLYSRMMREMRDSGIAGHVIIGTGFSRTEYEELGGKKTLFFPETFEISVWEEILEVQTTLILPASRIRLLEMLIERYDIRRLVIMDGSVQEFEEASGYLDYEKMMGGGYDRQGRGEGYWRERVQDAYFLR